MTVEELTGAGWAGLLGVGLGLVTQSWRYLMSGKGSAVGDDVGEGEQQELEGREMLGVRDNVSLTLPLAGGLIYT